jgi:hypothetical protein
MELIIGVGIWVLIFVVWYVRTYPEKLKGLRSKFSAPRKPPQMKSSREKRGPFRPNAQSKRYKALVETIEKTCAKERFSASDAAAMVEAVKQLMEIEPASGQIWEAYALDSLETAEIICDDCRIPVIKLVKKTGVRIQCRKCKKWLALKNSKVTILDPSRSDVEDWEK